MSLARVFDFKLKLLAQLVIAGMVCPASASLSTDTIRFNMDVLDVEDKKNIDLEQFSRVGYIMPGQYSLALKVNNDTLPDAPIPYYSPDNDPQGSVPCLSPTVTDQLGLTADAAGKVTWWHDGQCLDPASLPGMQLRGDLSTSSLYISIPQAYLEYSAPNWDPPSRWDEGISALLFDYSVSGNMSHSQNGGSNDRSLNGNGVAGINLGAWRVRADWQGQYRHSTGYGNGQNIDKSFDWNQFYAYRALTALQAKLTVGENYLNSGIFDSFRFIGGRLESDLNMLPPNLRGYAPEVTGVANSNSMVTISQQGRVIYSTQVAPGPFRIQDLNDAVSGTLDVRVEGEDGNIQAFQLDTASLPYLTRPGRVQYKVAVGQPTDTRRHSQGDTFVTGEFSWGVNNGWSLFGGTLNSQNYNAAAVGIGRDLLMFGAFSLDITHSVARLPGKSTLNGGSYRLNYTKRFDAIDGQIQFAGYRFSDRNFMSMSEFLAAKQSGERYGSSKELYTVSLSKSFRDIGMSMSLNYNHQTYWDAPNNDYYSLVLSKYFDIGSWKNISASLSANRSQYRGVHDDSVYLSLSAPLRNGANLGYSLSAFSYDTVNRVTYSDRLNDRTTWQVAVGNSRRGGSGSTFVSYQGDIARLSANAGYQHGQYRAAGFSVNGGLTVTPEGGALHREGMPGGTRLLVDTDGVSGVPVRGVGAPVVSNVFGKAVIGDMNSYYRSKANIDLNTLPDDVDALQSVVQATLTEGAVGYRQFEVISGLKAMTTLRFTDGSYPPFGAQVLNSKGRQTGIVGDAGSAYISGISPGEIMNVKWGDDKTCQLIFPTVLGDLTQELLLPCSRALEV